MRCRSSSLKNSNQSKQVNNNKNNNNNYYYYYYYHHYHHHSNLDLVDRRSFKEPLGTTGASCCFLHKSKCVSCHLTTVQVHTLQVMQCSRLPLEIVMHMAIFNAAAQYDVIPSRVSMTDDIDMAFLSVCLSL